jgi:hypothetical protein
MFWQDDLKVGDQVKVPKRGGGHVRTAVLALDKKNDTVKAVIVGVTSVMDEKQYTPWRGKRNMARFAAKDVRRG